MPAQEFTTPDDIKIQYFLDIRTLRKIRYWREFQREHCEAWLQDAAGVEQRWYSAPLGIQGRAGHRYLLCWARVGEERQFELVGACNLSTRQHRLCSGEGIVRSLFAPARIGRRAFWITSFILLAVCVACQFDLSGLERSIWSGLSAWHLLIAPVAASIVGRCVSAYRNARDVGRSFDGLVEAELTRSR